MSKKHILMLPLLLSGCAVPVALGGLGGVGLSAVEERGLGGVASDQSLRLAINSALFDHYEFIGLSLTVYNGRVLVTGIVPSEKEKHDAINTIKGVEGVREIIDGIKIQIDDDFLDDARDTWFSAQMKTRLYANQEVYAPNYVVHTFDRVIYIFGTAATPQEMQLVINEAREIGGVRKVISLIECKKKS